MIEVELPGGAIAEFPDGTPEADITAALSQAAAQIPGQAPDVQAPPADPIAAEARARRKQMGPLRRTLYGAERAFDEAATGLQQLTVGLDPEQQRELAIRRQMEKDIGVASPVSRMLGDTAIYAAPMAAAARGARMLAPANRPLARTLAETGGAAAAGGAIGAAQPVLEGESRANNAMLGAAGAGVGQVAGNFIGRGVEGFVPMSPAARRMPQKVRDELTLGQVADRDTVAGRVAGGLEEKAKSLPLFGQVVEDARDRGTRAWRGQILDEGSPDGFTPPDRPTTSERIGAIQEEFDNRYGAALKGNNVKALPAFEARVDTIAYDPKRGLVGPQREQVRDTIMNYYNDMFTSTNPNITADRAKKFESFLTSQARQYRGSNTPQAAEFAKAFEDAERAWTVAYRSQLPLATRRGLRPLDSRYNKYKTVERAAGYSGQTDGDFTPSQLYQAANTRTKNRSTWARGDGVLQPEANDGKRVLQDRIPNSGTADRSLAAGAALGGGLLIDPVSTAVTVGLGLPAMTTRTGRNLLTGETAAQRLLRRIRANEAARLAGPGLGYGAMDAMLDEESEN